MEATADQGPVSQRRVVEPRGAALAVLGRLQQRDDEEQQRSQGKGHAHAAETEPAAEDADSEGVDAEVVRGPELAQRLHHHQHHPGRQRRPGRRQDGADERLDAGAAQAAGHLQQGRSLAGESGAGGEIDIGIQQRREHERQSAETAHPQDGVSARRHLQHLPEQQLGRPRVVEDAGVRQGADVGREGQRQHQQPPQCPPAGEVVHGHQPGRGHADEGAQRRHQGDQADGGDDVAREDGPDQVAHIRREEGVQVGGHRQEGRTDQDGDRNRCSQPAARRPESRSRGGRRRPHVDSGAQDLPQPRQPHCARYRHPARSKTRTASALSSPRRFSGRSSAVKPPHDRSRADGLTAGLTGYS